MSNPRLAAFLVKLDAELDRYSDYRKELNRKPHTFVFHKRTLLKETLTQLRKGQKIELTKEDEAHIKKLVDDAAEKLHKQLEKIQGKPLKRPGGKTTVIFDEHTNVPIPKHYDQFLPYTAFTRVKFAYRTIMNEYFKNMQNYLRNHKDLDVIRNKSNSKEKSSILHFFDAGHDKNAGVFERFLDSKTSQIMKGLNTNLSQNSEIERQKIVKDLNTLLGIDLSIQKVDDLDMIIIKIESSSENRSRGAKQGLRSKQLRRKVKNFLANKADLKNLEGSDSLKKKKEKETVNEILDPFRKIKPAKVSNKRQMNKSSGKKITKKVSPKISAKKVPLQVKASVRKQKQRQKAKESPASSVLQMIGLINKKLPETVKKNMKEPALVNRTGRFADSVKVTEVAQTPKGFPSIGYTYQRNPYQVFEEGSRGNWSNGNRDPRDLIDKSIREIAAELLIGRLYTRRV